MTLDELLDMGESVVRKDVPTKEALSACFMIDAKDDPILLATPGLDGRQRAQAMRIYAVEVRAVALVMWTETWGAVLDPTSDDPIVKDFMAGKIRGVSNLPRQYRHEGLMLYAETNDQDWKQRHYTIKGELPNRTLDPIPRIEEKKKEHARSGNVFYPILPANILLEKSYGPLKPPPPYPIKWP